MTFLLVDLAALAMTVLVYWAVYRIRKHLSKSACPHVNRQRYQTSYGGEYLLVCADCNKQWMERT